MITTELNSIQWEFHHFNSLDTTALFELLKLRVDVFVVEQACAYPELDAHDTADNTLHLLGYLDSQLVAYARAMPDTAQSESVSMGTTPVVRIGRVVVTRSQRGSGVAQALMNTLIHRLENDFPDHSQILGAQDAVAFFYANLGFERVSDIYLEDNIPHVEMLRNHSASLPTKA